MKKTKIITPIEFFTLDLTDAILPKAWPSDIPSILKLQTGQHGKSYDVLASDEPWYQSLLKFVAKNQYTTKDDSLPIGINANSMQIGAKVYNSEQILVAQGKDKKVHLAEVSKKNHDLEQSLIPLREKFPGIKDKYLIEFDETQESLLNSYRPLTDKAVAYDVFNDIFMAGGGSTYKDESLASLGAYNSLVDFNTLKCTLDLFEKDELKILGEASEIYSYLTPIHSLINGQVKARNEKTDKLKMK